MGNVHFLYGQVTLVFGQVTWSLSEKGLQKVKKKRILTNIKSNCQFDRSRNGCSIAFNRLEGELPLMEQKEKIHYLRDGSVKGV